MVLALAVAVTGCGGDDGGSDAAPPTTEPVGEITTTTGPAAETGDIDVPALPRTSAVAVPSLGFGVAVPDGWQATLLSDDALEHLERAELDEPSFLEAARDVAATGAVLYAAGIDAEGRLSELEVAVQDDADTSEEGVRARAEEVAAGDELEDATVVDDGLDGGRVRVDYHVVPSADDGEPIDAVGSQLLVPDGNRLWSLIVTSEDEAAHRALLDLFQRSFVVDGN